MLGALRFRSPDLESLERLTEKEWSKALTYADRSGLTLPLGLATRDRLPAEIRSRIAGNFANNAERWNRARATYSEIASALEAAGLEHAVLKGFSHCPHFALDPRERWQSDIDLFVPEDEVQRAYKIALDLGYEPIIPLDTHPIDHLPTLIRRTGWQWKGDFFDVDMPFALELHFRFWDGETERFDLARLEGFWERRQQRSVEGLAFTALHPADAMGFSSLHIMRHLLRGSLRPSHVYELAWLLHHRQNDMALWEQWPELHDGSLRRIEAICFALAEAWFDCDMPERARDQVDALPQDVTRWLEMYSHSPLQSPFRPNKDELWLHWCLLDSASSRWAVLRRRLLPQSLPGPVDVHTPKHRKTWRSQLRSQGRYLTFAAGRVGHHVRALLPTAASAVRWFGSSLELGPDYWRFFLAEGFFDFGMFIFVFLYNLYLLQLGFREGFLGQVAGLMMAGNVAGSLLAAAAIERFGMRRTLAVSFTLMAAISGLRAVARAPAVLLSLAGAAGVIFSVWPVVLAPMVAAVTTDRNRRVGFSMVCSSGIAIGIFGGMAAGHLPGWVMKLHWAVSDVSAYRLAMLTGCALVLLALWPLSGIRVNAAAPASLRSLRKPSPVLIRFLIAMAVWNLGTGLFNSFTNVFFARHVHLPVGQIGYVFSIAQVAQVSAVLAAPVFFRQFGLNRSIAGMEFATGLALLGLAAVNGPVSAAVGYCFYMMAQYMSEPGVFTWLMESTPEGERNNASALNFLVLFGGQGIGAKLGGQFLERAGYAPVLTAAAIICCLAALLFRVLLREPVRETQSTPQFAAGKA